MRLRPSRRRPQAVPLAPRSETVAVISPHLDDAALSLGAGIAYATRGGAHVRVVTVLANDPDAEGAAAEWDARCGFVSAAEAARERRREDERACGLIGAEPVWLPFPDMEYRGERVDDDAVVDAAVQAVGDAESVVLPGHPLDQPDHRRLTTLLRDRFGDRRVGLYVEQPYAALRLLGRGRRTWSGGLTPRAAVGHALHMAVPTSHGRGLTVSTDREWQPVAADREGRRQKARAFRAYSSQAAMFGPVVLQRIALYERAAGGEQVVWLTPATAA